METVTVIKKLTELKSERGLLRKIEKEIGMPLNSLSAYVNGKKELPKKWGNKLAVYLTDFMNKERYPDGITELKSVTGYAVDMEKISMEQFNEFQKTHPQKWIRLEAICKEGYEKNELLRQKIDALWAEINALPFIDKNGKETDKPVSESAVEVTIKNIPPIPEKIRSNEAIIASDISKRSLGVVLERYAKKDEILKQIEAIKKETIPKERDTPRGKKVWNIDQQKRIDKLQSKL